VGTGLTPAQKAAFQSAANRWTKVIVGDLPPVRVEGEVIDDVVILAQGKPIDGPGRVLGQAGPTFLRPEGSAASALLPAKGVMIFDTADLEEMEAEGTLNDVITHEMGHVLGIGTIWEEKGLLRGAGTANPRFTGSQAKIEFGKLKNGGPRLVPVENTGGPGTRDGHWRDTIFGNELMTGFVGDAGNPLSRMTVASLADMGYRVDMEHAEDYELPNLESLADAGLFAAERAGSGMILPSIPVVLPSESLI
jgi:hypothetical protein